MGCYDVMDSWETSIYILSTILVPVSNVFIVYLDTLGNDPILTNIFQA